MVTARFDNTGKLAMRVHDFQDAAAGFSAVAV